MIDHFSYQSLTFLLNVPLTRSCNHLFTNNYLNCTQASSCITTAHFFLGGFPLRHQYGMLSSRKILYFGIWHAQVAERHFYWNELMRILIWRAAVGSTLGSGKASEVDSEALGCLSLS